MNHDETGSTNPKSLLMLGRNGETLTVQVGYFRDSANVFLTGPDLSGPTDNTGGDITVHIQGHRWARATDYHK